MVSLALDAQCCIHLCASEGLVAGDVCTLRVCPPRQEQEEEGGEEEGGEG